jgi:hypothetical protein
MRLKGFGIIGGNAMWNSKAIYDIAFKEVYNIVTFYFPTR